MAAGFIPDVIFNCAGVGLKALAYESSLEEQIDLIRLNIEALTTITLFFLPHMVKRSSGHIVNISSVAAFQPGPGIAVYSATKAYVNSFSQALSYECKDVDVGVLTVCPGPFLRNSEYEESVKKPGLFRKQRTLTTKQVIDSIEKGMHKKKTLVIPGIFNQFLAFCGTHLGIKLVMFFIPLFFKGSTLKPKHEKS